MRILMIICYLILIVVGSSFSILNADLIDVNLYLTTVKLPLSLLVMLTFGMGVLSGLLILLYRYVRLKIRMRHLKKQLRHSEKAQLLNQTNNTSLN